MFTTTGPERTAVGGASLDCHGRLEIQDPDLAWVDVSTGLDTPDWFNSAQVRDHIDANTMEFAAELLRDDVTTGLSLAPLLESSTLNRNGAGAYAPMLDLVRMWRISVAVMPHGVAPAGGDWKEIAKGYIDAINVNDSSQASISVTGRGEEAAIIDTEILDKIIYSVGSVDDMETVIQALLDDNMSSPPTLYVPVATSFIINEYEQDYGSLMGAIRAVADLQGYVVRYVYDSTGVNRLTLFLPRREAEPGQEDWSIASTEYLSLPVNRLDISGVRNYVKVRFLNETTGLLDEVLSPLTGTSGSITSFGRRALVIELAGDTQITTEARAQGLADAIRSDLEFPVLEQQFETFGFWFVQLTDYGKMLPNSVTY